MTKEFRKPKVVLHKDSWFAQTIHFVVRLFTRKDSYGNFTTTIGRTMYVPNGWYLRHPDERYRTMRHERRHMLQFRCWPFPSLGYRGVWRLNAVLFSLCYLFLLPVKRTMRAKFEEEGYTQTLLVLIELGQLDILNPHHRARWAEHMEQTFSNSTYAWMARKGEGRAYALRTWAGILDGLLVSDKNERVD